MRRAAGGAIVVVLATLSRGVVAAGQGAFVAPTGAPYRHVLNGSGDEAGRAIAVDRAGNTYIAGETSSPDFPVAAGGRRSRPGASRSAFVVKLDRSGHVVYATLLGGAGITAAHGIAVDTRGRAWVTGATNATDFPTTPSALQRSYGGGPEDAFVTALDRTGRIAYSTFLGDTHYDEGNAIALDRQDRPVLTGRTVSPQFPRVGGLQPPVDGGAFVTKLSRSGSRLIFSTVLGGDDRGNHGNTGFAIAVDRAGATYVAGVTNAAHFPRMRAMQPLRGGGADAFVTKISPSGRSIVYSTYLGGAGDDSARGIAADSAGYAYVTGVTTSLNFPVWHALQHVNAGGADAFVVKIEQHGGAASYSTYLGGSDDDGASAIAVAPNGRAYIAGSTSSADFPLAGGGERDGDAFVTGLSARGASVVYSATSGHRGATGLGIAVDHSGAVVMTGRVGASADGGAVVARLRPSR